MSHFTPACPAAPTEVDDPATLHSIPTISGQIINVLFKDSIVSKSPGSDEVLDGLSEFNQSDHPQVTFFRKEGVVDVLCCCDEHCPACLDKKDD